MNFKLMMAKSIAVVIGLGMVVSAFIQPVQARMPLDCFGTICGDCVCCDGGSGSSSITCAPCNWKECGAN